MVRQIGDSFLGSLSQLILVERFVICPFQKVSADDTRAFNYPKKEGKQRDIVGTICAEQRNLINSNIQKRRPYGDCKPEPQNKEGKQSNYCDAGKCQYI